MTDDKTEFQFPFYDVFNQLPPLFGLRLRVWRLEKKIGLRAMAKLIGVSPTYLSKIERDEFQPPAEDKVLRIAEILERDPDEMLALAGRVSSALKEIIIRRPRQCAALLRATWSLSNEDLARLIRQAERQAKKGDTSYAVSLGDEEPPPRLIRQAERAAVRKRQS